MRRMIQEETQRGQKGQQAPARKIRALREGKQKKCGGDASTEWAKAAEAADGMADAHASTRCCGRSGDAKTTGPAQASECGFFAACSSSSLPSSSSPAGCLRLSPAAAAAAGAGASPSSSSDGISASLP